MSTNIHLRVALIKRGIRQWQLAKLAGLPETTVSRIVSGRRSPSGEERRRLAAVLQMPEEQLFTDGQEQMEGCHG